jgi:hypothetical protein
MACVLIAECTTKSRWNRTFIVKIFDPHYPSGLRQEFGTVSFRMEALPAIAEAVKQCEYRPVMGATFEPPEKLAERTREILGRFLIWPLLAQLQPLTARYFPRGSLALS